jgi:uncharacterized membrane-anchored protein
MSHDWQNHLERPFRRFLSKIPEITIFFWIVKILATTVGGTFADFVSSTLGLGLTLTTVVMSAVLAVVLLIQFREIRYVATTYWLVMVLIGIVGTLIADGLADDLDVPLVITAAVFAVLLAAAFVAWYRTEKTLSIKTVDTPRREAFYWLTVLFTFSFGTAAGDWVVQVFRLRYAAATVLFALVVAAAWEAHRVLHLGTIVAFWIAFVATHPLGASLGDYLSQPVRDGGLGLGTPLTSLVFLLIIVGVVVYLSVTGRDRPNLDNAARRAGSTW